MRSRLKFFTIILRISQRLLAVNYFHKNAPSQMFDWILNTPLLRLIKLITSNIRYCFFSIQIFLSRCSLRLSRLSPFPFINLLCHKITEFMYCLCRSKHHNIVEIISHPQSTNIVILNLQQQANACSQSTMNTSKHEQLPRR